MRAPLDNTVAQHFSLTANEVAMQVIASFRSSALAITTRWQGHRMAIQITLARVGSRRMISIQAAGAGLSHRPPTWSLSTFWAGRNRCDSHRHR